MEDKDKILREIEGAKDLSSLEQIYKKYLGKKGEISLVFRNLKDLTSENRIKIAKEANDLKRLVEEAIKSKENQLKKDGIKNQSKKDKIDVTMPGEKIFFGHIHPLTKVLREISDIFGNMGFEIVDGPEVETEFYNFDALNMPKNHPARDMWDTFWLKENQKLKVSSKNKNFPSEKIQKLLLRTHTSPVQVRFMEKNNPPFRIIAPGRIFRHEATDASHETTFYQTEGLMVDKDITVANFKAVIREFFGRFFSKEVLIRLRPSFFPFTEPSFEVDMSCLVCGGKGCPACSQGGWIEMMGAGMVHPNVFKSVGYDAKKWQGFAFGVGVDRMAMMKYKIGDIRLFNSGDLRFLQQF